MEAALPRLLTKIRIDEVSAVDRGAGEGTRIILMKRYEPHVEEARRASYEKFLKIFTSKADAADDGDDDAGDRSDDAGGLADHPVVSLATLLVASGHKPDIASALDYLLNTPHGAALLNRVRTHKGESPMESIEKLKAERKQKLLAIGKAGGAVAMAKILVSDNDSHGLSEEEYTAIVTEDAQKRFPDKRSDSAFDKVFSDPGPDGVLLRKAHAVVKFDAMNGGNDRTESDKALDDLTVKADEYRKAHPELSQAQAFAKVFTDPANIELAASAHRRPSATSVFQFPR
jgi:hypothetical protein